MLKTLKDNAVDKLIIMNCNLGKKQTKDETKGYISVLFSSICLKLKEPHSYVPYEIIIFKLEFNLLNICIRPIDLQSQIN